MAVAVDFETFWNAYDKKTGSKAMAQQYWDGDKKTISRRPINDTDRVAIMGMAKRYVARYRGEKKEYQPLAQTFLHQRYWESELEATPKNEAVAAMATQLLGKMAERIVNKQ
ncbi:MAG: hypothetical protein HC896_00180 [Bacteroidales bacterium]|nr:hypothetical protein [Bacteroidales bacterium]